MTIKSKTNKRQWAAVIENFQAFLIAITILTLTPGLDTALVLRNFSRGGFSDSATTRLGISLGLNRVTIYGD